MKHAIAVIQRYIVQSAQNLTGLMRVVRQTHSSKKLLERLKVETGNVLYCTVLYAPQSGLDELQNILVSKPNKKCQLRSDSVLD